MDVNITQFNVQLYFKQPVLDNNDSLNSAFSQSEGFSSGQSSDQQKHHPMKESLSFFREGFKIAPVQSNVLPFRILQVMSYPNVLTEPDSQTITCLKYVATSLKHFLNVDVETDIYAVRVVYHSIVTGSPEIEMALSKLSTIDGLPSLSGKYMGHKNPMNAIQFTSKTGSDLSQPFWSDIRVSQFKSNSYVVTIFCEIDSFAGAINFIEIVKNFVLTFMQEMESAVAISEKP